MDQSQLVGDVVLVLSSKPAPEGGLARAGLDGESASSRWSRHMKEKCSRANSRSTDRMTALSTATQNIIMSVTAFDAVVLHHCIPNERDRARPIAARRPLNSFLAQAVRTAGPASTGLERPPFRSN